MGTGEKNKGGKGNNTLENRIEGRLLQKNKNKNNRDRNNYSDTGLID